MLMVLTTVPTSGLKSRLKEIFDPDLILGLGLALALDFALGYVATRLYPPLAGRPFGSGSPFDICGYDDLILYGIEIAGVLLTKGRLRKICVYAFWFSMMILFACIVRWKTGVGFF